MSKYILLSILYSWIWQSLAWGNIPLPAKQDLQPSDVVDHCYHWIRTRPQDLLALKIDFAQKNQGQFLHLDRQWTYGSGIYCAYSLLDSIDYGDRVIRIDVAPTVNSPVKVVNREKRWLLIETSELSKNSFGEVIQMTTEGAAAPVVKTPRSIKSWSANNESLMKDIQLTIDWAIQNPNSLEDQDKKILKLKYLLEDLKKESKVKRTQTFFPQGN